jgi:hypothetical protein
MPKPIGVEGGGPAQRVEEKCEGGHASTLTHASYTQIGCLAHAPCPTPARFGTGRLRHLADLNLVHV